MNFLKFYVRFADPAFNAKFDESIYSLTENKTTMGIEEMLIESFKKEGREEGRLEGRLEGRVEGRIEGRGEGREEGIEIVVKNLLLTGKFTVAEIANFANVSEPLVLRVKNAL